MTKTNYSSNENDKKKTKAEMVGRTETAKRKVI